MNLRSGVSAPAIIGVVAAVVIVAAGAFFFLSQPSGPAKLSTSSSTTSLSSSTQSATSATVDAKSLLALHLQGMAARSVVTILNDYQSDAVVTWQGNTAGLGGVYNGQGNIRLLLASALGTAQTLNLTPSGVSIVKNTGTQITVNATLALSGTSQILGPFNGTILASTTYTNSGGGWKISSENWNFKSLYTSAEGGATTFPEWQKVGEPISTRRSPDWLHNFSWDYGGLGTAVLLWVFALLVAVLAVTRVAWKPSR